MSSNLQGDRVLAQRPRLHEACLRLHDIAQELGAEEKLPTMLELRAQLGISVQTLNDAVRELEKRDILTSVRGVGIYVAPQKQRSLTGNVGFLTPRNMPPTQDVPYWGLLLAGMREAVRERGYHLLLIDDGANFSRWDKIDGAIVCETRDSRDAHEPGFAKPQTPRGFPRVAIFNEIALTPSVTIDDFDGTYQLTKHLIELGHRRIAYLAAINAGLPQLERRKQGYLKALKEAGIPADEQLMRELCKRSEWQNLTDWYRGGGEFYVQNWLQEDWNQLAATALIVQNDDAARGAITAFQAGGLKVPCDVSVVGFDGLSDGAPQLTTVRVPLFEIGHTAMRLLLDWLDNPQQVPQSVRLPVSFIAGKTSSAAKVLL